MRSEELQLAQLEALLGEKYQVLRRIGGGGMAQVFLARHRGHGGAFAVKVLAEFLAQDPLIVARFEQEARTAASLSGHPNIVPIFDIGQGDGLHYIIMQFVSGEDMASWLRRNGKLAPADAANVIAQTAEALIWAEQKHVVHRDLKPANMLLDTNGRITILDFGIARAADFADGLTRPGESVGTPYYMSPEQIRGQPCDARSDLYALGVVFFELLSGRRPFEQESVTAIQMAHLTEEPPSLLSIESSLPEVCGQIVGKLMQKRPEDRYQSPKQLLEELQSLGASSGPGVLRPELNMDLEQELRKPLTATVTPVTGTPVAGTPTSVLPARSSVARARTPVPAASAAMPVAASSPSVAVQTPPPAIAPTPVSVPAPAEPVPAPAPRKTSRAPWIAAALAVIVAAAVLAVFFIPVHPPAVLQDPGGSRMLLVPAGNFIFGDNAPGSPHPSQTKWLPDFYVDETEVSNAQYRGFVDATHRAAPVSPDYATQPDLPVANVSYDDAAAYAAWAHKELPTEEQWEKAARGTDGRPYPWGQEAWTNGIPTTLQPVDSSPDRKSPYGALNMAGNVFEWTATPFPAGSREIADMQKVLGNASFSSAWYAIKGGSFSPHGDVFFRCSLRRGLPSDQHSPFVGFRCVRAAPKLGFLARLRLLFSGR